MICNLSKLKKVHVPRDIKFKENEDKDTLFLTMTYNGITDNMQAKRAAFEAWSLLGKARGYKKVNLDIADDVKNIEEEKLGHYNRFLYRVLNFNNLFDWFSVSSSLEKDVKNFYNTYFTGIKLVYNVPTPSKSKESEGKANNSKISEHDMENYFVSHVEKANEYSGLNAKEYFSQLPVGLFKGEKRDNTRIFTGKKSAIDFWCITDDVLNIVELKIGENKSLGVLSEIFFYTCLMRDLHIDTTINSEPSNNTEIRGFNKIMNTNLKAINGTILLEIEHSLLKEAYNELKKASQKDSRIRFSDSIRSYKSKELINR